MTAPRMEHRKPAMAVPLQMLIGLEIRQPIDFPALLCRSTAMAPVTRSGG